MKSFAKVVEGWLIVSTSLYRSKVKRNHSLTIIFADRSKLELPSRKLTRPPDSTNRVRVRRTVKRR